MDGFILVNKPPGPTSHDVVDELRAVTGISQIGHAGTLDPLAEGLLIILVGNFTKKSESFMKLRKSYRAVLRLGLESDTQDIEGEIRIIKEVIVPVREDIENTLPRFLGKIKQVPPKFSAIKKDGKKSYKEARAGKEIRLEAREVEIFKLQTVWYKYPVLTLEVECGSGTYIRALSRDIGTSLRTGALLSGLKRISVGNYQLFDSVDFLALNSRNWKEYLRTSPLPKNLS